MEKLKVLIDEETIQKRIGELAKEIEKGYEQKELTLVCILKGSVFFTIDLAKKMNKKVKLAFMQVSSYGAEKVSSGIINLKLDLPDSLEGENILIVEDIIDTGNTLSYLIEHIKEKNPESIKICTLLDKPERREHDVKVDYVGFEIPNKFVIGYGLDYNEIYRNLPYIAEVE
ncbi:MAG: hypoxanthine phosphoribosyltransferase [Clostridia bacterium]|nr:hypoxanthine phosphoribosyltransferase [Clostridia bacterium]